MLLCVSNQFLHVMSQKFENPLCKQFSLKVCLQLCIKIVNVVWFPVVSNHVQFCCCFSCVLFWTREFDITCYIVKHGNLLLPYSNIPVTYYCHIVTPHFLFCYISCMILIGITRTLVLLDLLLNPLLLEIAYPIQSRTCYCQLGMLLPNGESKYLAASLMVCWF